jgi:hypothetical protein
MGKGAAQRRRTAAQLRAQAAKKGSYAAEAPLEAAAGKKRGRGGGDDPLPASLRRMLALKAQVEGGDAKRARIEPPRGGGGGGAGAPAGAAAPPAAGPAAPAPKRRRAPRPDALPLAPEGAAPLKARKKAFLAKRKLAKRRGGAGARAGAGGGGQHRGGAESADDDDSDDNGAPAAAAAAAALPRFGEQADQPINMNLKRRHWAERERTAADRCKDVFERLMQRAAAGGDAGGAAGGGGSTARRVDEAERLRLADAYRDAARAARRPEGAAAPAASRRTLASLAGREAAKNPVV